MTTEQQTQADTIRNKYNADMNNIRGNRTLSGDGKRAAIAKLYVDTSASLDALADEQTGNGAARAATLERTVFGLPVNAPTADVVSYRDALDRVSSIEPTNPRAGELLTSMYKTAKLSGDSILGKAILLAAFDNRNVDLINEYIEDNPSLDAAISELWDVRFANRVDPTAMWIFHLPKPDEFANLDDVSIRAIAASKSTATA
ncbi:hypothetical protein [Curtobacterium sp. ISL-83]|uniref:hypothetical protein n=1 Tax=Curtobacterium sp. ISL-83 TaxID=2819145 RepID=UPI001BEB9832|nr:hypothetical protein [Curtobacterium sp. ISL-83]MBT2501422.1 hypothetical protein [Curtobacterium sp. ISL-83]